MNDRVAVPVQVASRLTRRERLEALYLEHHDAVWRLLRRLGMDAARASDAAQQVFLVAMERLDDIEEGKARAFLLGVAVRISRKLGTRQSREELVAELPEVDAGHRPDEALEQQRRRQQLDRVLAAMSEELRVVLVLHDVEGYTQREIAQMLEVPDGTAASRLRRAREAFDALVERELEGGRG